MNGLIIYLTEISFRLVMTACYFQFFEKSVHSRFDLEVRKLSIPNMKALSSVKKYAYLESVIFNVFLSRV